MSRLKKILKHFLYRNRWAQVRIENTNLCVNECIMCPREKMTRPKGTMNYEDFCRIIKQINIKYKSELHLHGFGEALLDSYLFDKIKYIKKFWPNFTTYFLTTLATADKGLCERIIDSGVDSVYISCYGNSADEYKKIFKRDNYQKVINNINYLKEYSMKSNSKIKITQSSTSLNLHNYGNGRYYNKPPINRICPVVSNRRKYILQITWDGYVIPCCFDYDATIRFGNIFSKNLKEIFNSNEYKEFKTAQYNKDYSKYKICVNCDKRDI